MIFIWWLMSYTLVLSVLLEKANHRDKPFILRADKHTYNLKPWIFPSAIYLSTKKSSKMKSPYRDTHLQSWGLPPAVRAQRKWPERESGRKPPFYDLVMEVTLTSLSLRSVWRESLGKGNLAPSYFEERNRDIIWNCPMAFSCNSVGRGLAERAPHEADSGACL